jgi:hypothetical protein
LPRALSRFRFLFSLEELVSRLIFKAFNFHSFETFTIID